MPGGFCPRATGTGLRGWTVAVAIVLTCCEETPPVVVEPPGDDRGALSTFYEATEGDGWRANRNWLTTAPLGEWYGVDTNEDGRVSVLDLGFNRLSGKLPPDIGDLSELERFMIRWNDVSGPIPDEIGRLSGLTELDFSRSDLTGSIPARIGDLSRLRILRLSSVRMTGPIPASLGNLADLVELHLFQTGRGEEPGLTGSIPGELGRLVKLTYLDLGENSLTGPIPPELGNLGRLWSLSLRDNELSGGIPPALGKLTGLGRLHLSQNPQLKGELPRELTALRSLDEFIAGETGICAPANPAFANWLDGILKRRVKTCGREGDAYLTQAVQSIPYPVPLVAGDSALLRVFVTAEKDNSARIPPVRATFYDASGSRIRAVDIPGLERTIPTEVDEGDLETSSNAVIPASVVEPGLQMVIEVDPHDELDPDPGVRKRIPAEGRLQLDVVEMPTLDLTIVPFVLRESKDSSIVPLTKYMTKEDTLLWRVRDLLPVGDMELTVRKRVITPYSTAGKLLAEVKLIRTVERGTGHYLGMMAEASLHGSAIGLAEAPGRVSFSIPRSTTIAHELGHNFDLLHANRCGSGKGDLNYPSGTGAINAWGYDFGVGELVDPEVPDLMTYCENHWIGDYHFANALRFRVEDEGDTLAAGTRPATRVLLLSGGVDAQGNPFLEPAIVIDAAPSLPRYGGRHRIAGRAADGEELFSLLFDMPDIADGDGSSFFTFAVPAPDAWAGTLAGVTFDSGGRSHTIDRDTDRPVAILRDPATGHVREIVRGLPPGPEGREAAIALASETGLEVFFSRGIPGPEDWRR